MRLTDNGRCFACGPLNPIGLRLQFRTEGEEYVTEFVPTEEHQGFFGLLHGGLLATVLDEVMARFVWVRGIPAVTAEMKVVLRQPAHIGQRLTIAGRITRERGRLILCEARACRDDGTVVATAEAKLMRVSSEAAAVADSPCVS